MNDDKREAICVESRHCTTESGTVTSKDEQSNGKNPSRMTEDHTVVICEEVLKRREILLDMCSTRETEINRKRAEAWDEVHMATMTRCQRKLRLEQIKRVWRHQKNRVRHILNVEKLGSNTEVTLEDVIAARKGFMTDYEIAIARAYVDVPPRCRSPSNRRLDELDLSFRKRVAASPSVRIDDSVTSPSPVFVRSSSSHVQTGFCSVKMCSGTFHSKDIKGCVHNGEIDFEMDDGDRQFRTTVWLGFARISIERSFTLVLDRIAAECVVEAQNQAQTDPAINPVSNARTVPSQSMIESDDSSCTSENVQPVKRKRTGRRQLSIINEQYEMIKAQRIAFEEQAQMYRAMRSFIEESTRTIRDLVGRVNGEQQSSAIESSPSESNLEFAPSNIWNKN
uniref:Regulatory protein zeste n=1 Tax=Angiostrongylus cantonensis TaxID=6313 RepID=A0A158P8P2_ANGCA